MKPKPFIVTRDKEDHDDALKLWRPFAKPFLEINGHYCSDEWRPCLHCMSPSQFHTVFRFLPRKGSKKVYYIVDEVPE